MKYAVLSVLCVAVVVFGCVTTPSGSIDSDGLEGYWQFDRTGADSSIQNRHLALVGSPMFETGLFGDAIILDGSGGEYAWRSINDPIFNVGNDDFTIQIWISFVSTENEQTLIEKWTQDDLALGYTLTKLSGNSLRFARSGEVELVVDSAPLTIALDIWHQFVVRRSGASLELFFDGDLVANDSIGTTAVTPSPNPLLFGKRAGGSFALNGRIDEAVFWSRALSDTEISTYYNDGTGLQISSL